jgi:drug/metabolite transporter (DMT)-like permease
VENQNIGLLAALGAVLVLAISLGFNSRLQYTFPLLTVYQHVYFFGIVVFITADKCIQDESKSRYLLLAIASLAFMFANADFGTIFLASITAITVLAYLFDRKPVYLSG